MKQKLLGTFNNLSAKQISVFFFILGIISGFFQINAVVMQDLEWGGQFSPYTTFQLYFSDIMFLLAFIAYGFYIFGNSKRVFISLGNNHVKTMILTVVFFALISYFFSINETVTFFGLIQMFKLLVIYIFVINRLIPEQTLINLILGCLSFQLILGIIQFLTQSSIGLSFLGESVIGPDVLNVAKIDIGGTKVIRPYGTFTHANIFGGLMSIGFLLSVYLFMQDTISKKKTYILSSAFLLGTVLSFSRSAWLAALISAILFLSFRKFKITYLKIRNFSLTFVGLIFIGYLTGILDLILIRLQLFGDMSAIERMAQIKTSFSMMFAHPFGVGLGNHTNAAGQFSPDKLMPWEFEPVHNTFLLIGTELGMFAMAGAIAATIFCFLRLFTLLAKTEGKYRCFPIYFSIILITELIILLNLDHYFYTNYSAGIVLMLVLGIMTNYLANLESNELNMEK